MRVVLFDLGNTLEHQGTLLPGALEVLGVVRAMRDAGGSQVALALASDFDMPANPSRIPSIRRQYLEIIERLGIRPFFEPVEERVTLSTEVGVFKPDRRIFQAVIDKLGGGLRFADIIFVTENRAHVAAARQLGLTAVHFKGPGEATGEVERLSELVPLIRDFVAGPALGSGGPLNQVRRSVRDMTQEFSTQKSGDIPAAAQALAQALTEFAAQLRQTAQGGTAGTFGQLPQTGAGVGAVTATQINIFEDDPFSENNPTANPATAATIAVAVPANSNPALQTRTVESQPVPARYTPGTADFRFWVAQEALARGINFWTPLLPPGTRWTAISPLRVTLAAGQSLNASYNRALGLRFFQQTVQNVTITAAESPDVVCHELGHAILDAIRPELFSAANVEGAAFHESFGDITSILAALQLPSLRAKVLAETQGRLNVNSRLSRVAEQLGWGIRQLSPTAVDSDSLRNAANRFFYQPPSQLPPSAPSTQLSTEEHSYSRVFTGAFLDALAGMVNTVGGASDTNLLVVSRDLGQLLIDAVLIAPITARYFSQVAANMIQADQTRNGGRYRNALRRAFVQHGILAPAAAAALAEAPTPEAVEVPVPETTKGMAGAGIAAETTQTVLAYGGDVKDSHLAGPEDAPELPTRQVAIGPGLALRVHVAVEHERFAAAPTATGGGVIEDEDPEEDARSFVEDLIQLGRIEFEVVKGIAPEFGGMPGEASPKMLEMLRTASEEVHDKTHVVIATPDGPILKRLRFNCGLRCRPEDR